MPTAFRLEGFRFFFYSNEGDEPMHVHVEKGNRIGKVWLQPTIKVAYMNGFTSKEEKRIIKIISEKIVDLRDSWNEHFE